MWTSVYNSLPSKKAALLPPRSETKGTKLPDREYETKSELNNKKSSYHYNNLDQQTEKTMNVRKNTISGPFSSPISEIITTKPNRTKP